MQHYIPIFDQLLNSITVQPPHRNDSPTAFDGSVNRPSPSFKISCFQKKAKCKAVFKFYLYENNEKHFHVNGFALSLTVRQRPMKQL